MLLSYRWSLVKSGISSTSDKIIKSLGRFGKMVKDGHPKQVLQAVAGVGTATGVGAVAVGASQEQDQRTRPQNKTQEQDTRTRHKNKT